MELKRCTKCGENKPNTNEYFAFQNKHFNSCFFMFNNFSPVFFDFFGKIQYITHVSRGIPSPCLEQVVHRMMTQGPRTVFLNTSSTVPLLLTYSICSYFRPVLQGSRIRSAGAGNAWLL